MKIKIGNKQSAVASRQSAAQSNQKEKSRFYWLLATGYCLLVFLCLLATADCRQSFAAQEPTLEEVAERLQNKYRQTDMLQADFHQVNFYKAVNQKQEATGKFWIKKPGKMRWDYSRPEKNQIISDGKSLWIYTPAEKQVIKGKISEAFTGTPQDFLMGLGDLNRRFHIAFANPPRNKDGFLVLNLTSKEKEPTIGQITLEVAPQDYSVERFTLIDLYGNRTTLIFANIRFNQEMADSLFQFKVPAGVEVLTPPGVK